MTHVEKWFLRRTLEELVKAAAAGKHTLTASEIASLLGYDNTAWPLRLLHRLARSGQITRTVVGGEGYRWSLKEEQRAG